MSLVGFQAQNHPQQVRHARANDDVDDRATTLEVFAPLAERFGGFTVDVAAAAHNTKCVEPSLRRGTDGLRCEFLAGRIRFLRKGQTRIGPNERPPFGCCLLIWDGPRSAVAA